MSSPITVSNQVRPMVMIPTTRRDVKVGTIKNMTKNTLDHQSYSQLLLLTPKTLKYTNQRWNTMVNFLLLLVKVVLISSVWIMCKKKSLQKLKRLRLVGRLSQLIVLKRWSQIKQLLNQVNWPICKCYHTGYKRRQKISSRDRWWIDNRRMI